MKTATPPGKVPAQEVLSPRLRGWSSGGGLGSGRAPVVPAPAGMARGHCSRIRGRHGCPRARGDGPARASRTSSTQSSPPRLRTLQGHRSGVMSQGSNRHRSFQCPTCEQGPDQGHAPFACWSGKALPAEEPYDDGERGYGGEDGSGERTGDASDGQVQPPLAEFEFWGCWLRFLRSAWVHRPVAVRAACNGARRELRESCGLSVKIRESGPSLPAVPAFRRMRARRLLPGREVPPSRSAARPGADSRAAWHRLAGAGS